MQLRLSLATLVSVLVACPVLAEERMNVLLIVSDDLTNNALGCYGNALARTPNIDGLARRGVRFDRAYCQYPSCNPSRSSFLTGLRPDTTKVLNNGRYFRDVNRDVQTLPQTFRKAGYHVARVGKVFHYGVPDHGDNDLDDAPSWDKAMGPRGRDVDDEDKIFTLTPERKDLGRFWGTLSWLAADGTDAEQTDGKIAAEVAKLLEANKDRPFFLGCGFLRPHAPYVAPKNYFGKFPLEKLTVPAVPADHRKQGPAIAFASAHPEFDAMSDDLRRQGIQAYFASTSFMDAQVGKVLETLEKLKLADRTIVVFISDHGYHLGEHGLWQKNSLFENAARVPLIIHDPRAKGNGAKCGRIVELLDLYPTLTELCGLAAPKTVEGKSLKSLLHHPAADWDRPAFTQIRRDNGKQGYSVRTDRYRYTEWENGKLGVQLFDYDKDPNELKNLADDPKSAETAKQLKALLTGKH
jgi:uncharacterized sulfatase